jgi:hypothetical protein
MTSLATKKAINSSRAVASPPARRGHCKTSETAAQALVPDFFGVYREIACNGEPEFYLFQTLEDFLFLGIQYGRSPIKLKTKT